MSTMTKLFVLGFCFLLTSCMHSSTVRLTEADKGREIEVTSDQVLTIALKGNPTTGYTWTVGEDTGGLWQQIGETSFASDSSADGAGGVQTLRFEAVGTGQTELTLIYHRPWEEEVDPLEPFSVQMTVR